MNGSSHINDHDEAKKPEDDQVNDHDDGDDEENKGDDTFNIDNLIRTPEEERQKRLEDEREQKYHSRLKSLQESKGG